MHYDREGGNIMKTINVEINDSVASVDDRNCGPAGSVNNVEMVFTFSEEWNGFDKRVVFINAQQEAATYQLIENDTALITANALKYDGIIYFSVTGTKIVDDVLTEKTLSVAEYLTVDKSVDGGTIEPPLDYDLYAQMIARIVATELIASAASALTAEIQGKLDNGEFIGAQGIQGIQGISITNAVKNSLEHLIITLSDGQTFDCGYIKGNTGATGATGGTGNTGIGIQSATVNISSHLIISLTDSSVIDCGYIKGDTGNTGATGISGIYPETHISATGGTFALDPNRLYIFDNAITSALTLTFNAPTENFINEYLFVMTISGTPVITLPIGSTDWFNGVCPFTTGKLYLISAIKYATGIYLAQWGGK